MANRKNIKVNRLSKKVSEARSEAKLSESHNLSETPIMLNRSNNRRHLPPMKLIQSRHNSESNSSEVKSTINKEKTSVKRQGSIKSRSAVRNNENCKIKKGTKNKRQSGTVSKKSRNQRSGVKCAPNKRKLCVKQYPSRVISRSSSQSNERCRYYLNEWVFDNGNAHRRLEKGKNLSNSYVPSCFMFDSGKLIKAQTGRSHDIFGGNSPVYDSRRHRTLLGDLRAMKRANFRNSPNPIYYSSESDLSNA